MRSHGHDILHARRLVHLEKEKPTEKDFQVPDVHLLKAFAEAKMKPTFL